MAIRIFDHYVHLPVVLLALVEFAVTFAALVAGHYVVVELDWIGETAGGRFKALRCLLPSLIVVASMAAMGLYRLALRATFAGVAARVIVAILLAGFFLPFLYYLIPSLYVHPIIVIASGAAVAGALLIVRLIFLNMVDESYFKRRIIVLGAGTRAEQFLTLRRQSDRRGFKLVRFITTAADKAANLPEKRIRKMPDDLYEYARRHRIDEIVIALDDRRKQLPIRSLLECRLQGIDVTDVVSFLERETGKINLSLVSPSWLIFESGFRRRLPRRVVQRLFDIVASGIVLIIASPIMLIAAVLILLEDGQPVFYRQRRVGQNNVPFNVLKFRSMRTDAEAGGKAIWAKENDDRVTRVGRVFRKLRIDELPQLLNVLAGSMSVVGPRPERPEFVDQLSEDLPYYLERHRVKPGITGWAQLCYPYGSSAKDAFEKLQYDLYYVKNRTLLFDFMILLQTAEVVIWQKGSR